MINEFVVLVTGVVQGVGFRPFVARLAHNLGLSGRVKNTSSGVVIIVQGSEDGINEFLRRLKDEHPAIASIQKITIESKKQIAIEEADHSFAIEQSERQDRQEVLIPPDIATCDDCLREMDDPSNRRYRYPFINCTNCGPRYTIIRALPYDRAQTTMACFPMCEACNEEYEDPEDRRYHAQPNACRACGPKIWLAGPYGEAIATGDEAIDVAIAALKNGKIVAIKGIGGYHLACDPTSDAVVTKLRERKGRPSKPFAIMAADLNQADALAYITPAARELLLSPRRPIVICPKRANVKISPAVAPAQDTIGIMLPYTPIHHLIMKDMPALIMTSANISDSPLISGNREALKSLQGIADAFLMHNRDIYVRIDDSVMSMAGNRPVFLRRARGYVPQPFIADDEAPPILGAGAEMKATFSLSHGRLIFTSQYLGDMKELPSLALYEEVLSHMIALYNVRPRFLVYDLHPQFLSTSIAKRSLSGIEDSLPVQHHFAHFAACLQENRHYEEAMGLIMDGTGYGEDGSVWGGELLAGSLSSCRRIGHLLPTPLLGGDRSVLEPWRHALSLMATALGEGEAIKWASRLWPQKEELMRPVLTSAKASPITTSCGRLFDGIAALLGVRDSITYDAQAAMELEAMACGAGEFAPFSVVAQNEHILIDWRPAVIWTLERLGHIEPAKIAAAFHDGLSKSLAEACSTASEMFGLKHVALSGGTWQNRRLFSMTCSSLRRLGLLPLVHRFLPPNDECVSFGQVAVGITRWGRMANIKARGTPSPILPS
jgi:hydrogenase maturation protein HypF